MRSPWRGIILHYPPASTSCAWTSPTTAAGSARRHRHLVRRRDQVAAGRIERTHITMFTFDETTNVGRDSGSPVTTPTPDRQRLHRHRPLGPDRLGRRRPSPPHPTRAVSSGGHDPPLARVQASSARATPQLRRDSARHAEQGRAACWVPLHRVRAGEVAWPHLILHGSVSVDP